MDLRLLILPFLLDIIGTRPLCNISTTWDVTTALTCWTNVLRGTLTHLNTTCPSKPVSFISNCTYVLYIAKGTTDPRVEFISQVYSSQFSNLD